MISPTSLRIDAPIQPASCLRLLFYMLLASVMVILTGLASLALWQYVLIFVVSVAVVSYLALSRPISNYPWVICLSFIVIEPYQRHLSVTVFRDQVSAEHWRELTILANTISH